MKERPLKPYMAYARDMRDEGACLVFARNHKEAKKAAWPIIKSWWDCDYIDLRVGLIKDGDHLYAEAKQDKLEAGIPHVIETPTTCWECLCWGDPIGEDGLCDQCRDDMEFDER